MLISPWFIHLLQRPFKWRGATQTTLWAVFHWPNTNVIFMSFSSHFSLSLSPSILFPIHCLWLQGSFQLKVEKVEDQVRGDFLADFGQCCTFLVCCSARRSPSMAHGERTWAWKYATRSSLGFNINFLKNELCWRTCYLFDRTLIFSITVKIVLDMKVWNPVSGCHRLYLSKRLYKSTHLTMFH